MNSSENAGNIIEKFANIFAERMSLRGNEIIQVANAQLVTFYWNIGQYINTVVSSQEQEEMNMMAMVADAFFGFYGRSLSVENLEKACAFAKATDNPNMTSSGFPILNWELAKRMLRGDIPFANCGKVMKKKDLFAFISFEISNANNPFAEDGDMYLLLTNNISLSDVLQNVEMTSGHIKHIYGLIQGIRHQLFYFLNLLLNKACLELGKMLYDFIYFRKPKRKEPQNLDAIIDYFQSILPDSIKYDDILCILQYAEKQLTKEMYMETNASLTWEQIATVRSKESFLNCMSAKNDFGEPASAVLENRLFHVFIKQTGR